MDLNSRCDTVLLVTEGDSSLIDAFDALLDDGMGVLLARDPEHALGAMQSGFRPDVALVDLAFGPASLGPLLHALLDEPTWRALPVLGVPEASTSLFQIFPRERTRELPFPPEVAQLRELLDFVCTDANPPAPELHP